MFRLGLFAHAASSGMAVALTRRAVTRASVLRPVSQAGHAGSCAPLNQSAFAGRKLHSFHAPECSQTTLDKVCNAATAAVAVAGALTASAFAVFATDPAASMPPKKRKVGSGSASGDDISPASPRRSPRKISTVGRWATARRRVLSPNEGTRGNVRYTAAMSAEREIALAARKAEKNVKEGGAAPLMAGEDEELPPFPPIPNPNPNYVETILPLPGNVVNATGASARAASPARPARPAVSLLSHHVRELRTEQNLFYDFVSSTSIFPHFFQNNDALPHSLSEIGIRAYGSGSDNVRARLREMPLAQLWDAARAVVQQHGYPDSAPTSTARSDIAHIISEHIVREQSSLNRHFNGDGSIAKFCRNIG